MPRIILIISYVLLINQGLLSKERKNLDEQLSATVEKFIRSYDFDQVMYVGLRSNERENLQIYKKWEIEKLKLLQDPELKSLKLNITKATFEEKARLLAREDSYVLFFLKDGQNSGYCLHYNVEFGIDCFSVYSITNNKKIIKISGGSKIFKISTDRTRVYRVMIPDWRQSSLHLKILNEINKESRQKQK